jgi:DUF4097 and DUF4098 domain-containing protein YvlB
MKLALLCFAVLTTLSISSGAPWSPPVAPLANPRDDFKERDEINQTYQLGPGARVEISTIRGPVEISDSDGATAEVRIVRTARTRADLDYHKIQIEHTGNSLTVRGVQERDRRAQDVRVNHHVVLKLPRRTDVSVSTISGWLKAGDIDGSMRVNSISGSAEIGNVTGKLQVNSVSGSLEVGNVAAEAETRVNSISGNVDLRQVNGALEVTSVSGAVNATVVSLSPPGIRINSVSGSVEIGIKGDLNADFVAQGVTGEIYLDVPNAAREAEGTSHVRARIGAGGTPITVSSISGNVRLKRS